MSQSNGLLVEDKKRRSGQTDPVRAQQWKEASQRYRDKKRRRIEELQAAVNSLEKDIEKLKQERNETLDEVARAKKENQTLWNGFATTPTAPMWRKVFNFEERLFDMLTQWKAKREQELRSANQAKESSQVKEEPQQTPTPGFTPCPPSSTPSPSSYYHCHSSPSSPSMALVTNRYYNGNDFTQQQQQQHYNNTANAPPKRHDPSFRPPPMAGSFCGNSPSSYVSASTQASEQAGSNGDGDSDGDSDAGAQLLVSSRLPPVVAKPHGQLQVADPSSGVMTIKHVPKNHSNSDCNNNNTNYHPNPSVSAFPMRMMSATGNLCNDSNCSSESQVTCCSGNGGVDPFHTSYIADLGPSTLTNQQLHALNQSYELRVPSHQQGVTSAHYLTRSP